MSIQEEIEQILSRPLPQAATFGADIADAMNQVIARFERVEDAVRRLAQEVAETP